MNLEELAKPPKFPATVVTSPEEPNPDGLVFHYQIGQADQQTGEPTGNNDEFARIIFQRGPMVLGMPNGCTEADVVGVLIHRLCALQKINPGNENLKRAQGSAESMLYWLNRGEEPGMLSGETQH